MILRVMLHSINLALWPCHRACHTQPVMQERNEVRVGSLVTHKTHPCSAAVDLIAQRGLSWPQAKLNLLARRHPRWHPGEGKERQQQPCHVSVICLPGLPH